MASGLARAKVSGRMEVFKAGDDKTIIVDYAHNQMSFETLFRSVRRDYPGREVSIVFGCPGGKALGRRRELGAIAGEFADAVYLTEEDAGEEDVAAICAEIAAHAGAPPRGCHVIIDRGEAIREAIRSAAPGGVVLVTGKGRETRQKRGTEYVETPSDVEYVSQCYESASSSNEPTVNTYSSRG
jgi:UDP-N-acetylmuramoyl-L-alanyl-D-glutamate--2,6-diaminopimelate ligase